MALDVGDKRVGVAVSDATGILAMPLEPLVGDKRIAMRELERLARTWDVTTIVVGLPRHLSGHEGRQAETTRSFAATVTRRLGLPVCFWDERLSTVEADRRLRAQYADGRVRRHRVDSAAAALVLQAYLDRQRVIRERRDVMSDKEQDHLGAFSGEDDEVITLTDEDGKDHEFVVVDVIEVSSKEYAILLPYDTADEEETEAVILRIEKGDDGDDQLVEIDDENEWQSVVDAYEQVLEEDDDEE